MPLEDSSIPPVVELPRELRINEVVSNNEGVWVDELGETDDYLEWVNASDTSIHLEEYRLVDRGGVHALPDLELNPDELVLLWDEKRS
jgi:hypothetical protein